MSQLDTNEPEGVDRLAELETAAFLADAGESAAWEQVGYWRERVEYLERAKADFDAEHLPKYQTALAENSAKAAEIARLVKAVGLQMEEKHKHAAEARLWFEKAQEAKAEYTKLRIALERIAKPEQFYLTKQFKWAQDIALAALGLSEGVVYEVNHKEQALSAIIVKLQEALVTIASHGFELSREDCRRIAKEAVGLP